MLLLSVRFTHHGSAVRSRMYTVCALRFSLYMTRLDTVLGSCSWLPADLRVLHLLQNAVLRRAKCHNRQPRKKPYDLCPACRPLTSTGSTKPCFRARLETRCLPSLSPPYVISQFLTCGCMATVTPRCTILSYTCTHWHAKL